MIVYFSAFNGESHNDISLYRDITRRIREQGHVIANDWVNNAVHELDTPSLSAEQITRDATNAIRSAEVIIIEASGRSGFGVGYEVGFALQNKKPILMLIRRESAATSYAAGLDDELITQVSYEEHELKHILDEFLKDNNLQKKDLRFNFVIARQIHNHLRLRSYKTGKTKAEVVRDLLQRDMESGQD